MSGAKHWEQDKEATVYIGNLDERVTDALVWELMLQAGRIVNVHLPKDRVTQTHQGYGFVEFQTEEDAEYSAKIMNQVRLFGKPIRVNKASADKQKTLEIGAELFIGNLDTMVDEKTLYDTFSRFGTLIAPPKVTRGEDNLSKGYGFVSFADFESSDDAIANMHGQYLMNKEISVQYAYKKDGKGDRHGDEAERMLVTQARKHNVNLEVQPLPPQLFAAPPVAAAPIPMAMNTGRSMPAAPPPGFAPPAGFGGQPPPMRAQMMASPLPPPPSGLPARPPPSLAGYGGPQGFAPPGYGAPPQAGFGPQGAPPGMLGGPPPGNFPPGFAPPPSMPPGFQQYQQR